MGCRKLQLIKRRALSFDLRPEKSHSTYQHLAT